MEVLVTKRQGAIGDVDASVNAPGDASPADVQAPVYHPGVFVDKIFAAHESDPLQSPKEFAGRTIYTHPAIQHARSGPDYERCISKAIDPMSEHTFIFPCISCLQDHE